MRKNDISNGNKVIAEFMGLVECEHPYKGNFTYAHCEKLGGLCEIVQKEMQDESWYVYPRFHESWDWLMPVIDKIELLKLDGRYTRNRMCTLHWFTYKNRHCATFEDNDDNNESFSDGDGETKIEATYIAVVNFIEWYNENSGTNSSV